MFLITRSLSTLFILFFFFNKASLTGNERLIPPPLNPGDTIAIIAPASPPDETPEQVSRMIKSLIDKGFRVKIAPNLMTRYGYFAGTDRDRAQAFMNAWLDPEVKALWCYRGGYGCVRILEKLDFDQIKKHPKILLGMSDITVLHAALNQKCGLVTYLAPNLNAVVGDKKRYNTAFNETELLATIGPKGLTPQDTPYPYPVGSVPKKESAYAVVPGLCRGRLTGGTLSLVASLVGTPWQLDTQGKILVLEDVDEQPYRIDRLLAQLECAGLFEAPAGVILSSWKGCQGKNPKKTLSIEHIFRYYFGNRPYPVMVGFPSGHIASQVTLPLHTLAELDSRAKTLKLLEPSVQNP